MEETTKERLTREAEELDGVLCMQDVFNLVTNEKGELIVNPLLPKNSERNEQKPRLIGWRYTELVGRINRLLTRHGVKFADTVTLTHIDLTEFPEMGFKVLDNRDIVLEYK